MSQAGYQTGKLTQRREELDELPAYLVVNKFLRRANPF